MTREERIEQGRMVRRSHPEIPEVQALLAKKRLLEKKHQREGQQIVDGLKQIAPNGGDIGGIRGRSRRAKEKSFNRSFARAAQHVKEDGTLKGINVQLKRLKGRISQRRRYGDPEHHEKQGLLKSRVVLALFWQSIQVGDRVHVGGNSPAVVEKKNPKSFRSEMCVYTIKEIIGFDPEKVPGLQEVILQQQGTPEMDRLVLKARRMYLSEAGA